MPKAGNTDNYEIMNYLSHTDLHIIIFPKKSPPSLSSHGVERFCESQCRRSHESAAKNEGKGEGGREGRNILGRGEMTGQREVNSE